MNSCRFLVANPGDAAYWGCSAANMEAVNNGLATRLMAVLAISALTLVGCGDLVEPEAYAPSTSTTLVGGIEQQIDSQVEEAPEVVDRVKEFVPPPPDGYIPTLLVSGSNYTLGVDQISLEDGKPALDSSPLGGEFEELATVRAIDDFGKGLVVEQLDGTVFHRPSGAEPLPLGLPGERLLDVSYWDGSPQAFIETRPGQVERVQLLTEAGAELQREPHFQLAAGETIVAFSASPDLQAVIVQDDQCGELRFYAQDGEVLDLPGPVPPPCTFPDRPSFGAVALSPDGEALAYTIVSYRSDGTPAATTLVARELLSGAIFADPVIGEDLDSVTSLTFDGERAAYLRESRDDDNKTVTVLDLTVERSELPVELLGAGDVRSVSFARIPVGSVG